MHIGHILLVEATSGKEAESKAYKFVDSCAQDRWSDWSEIGGRWDGEFDGSNILCYKTNPELFDKKIAMWQASMQNEIDRLLEQVGDLTISELVSISNIGKEKQLEGDDYLASYRAMKVLRMSENSGYDSHSQVFDTETYTSNLKYFRDRVANAPENQYAVIWDFHF